MALKHRVIQKFTPVQVVGGVQGLVRSALDEWLDGKTTMPVDLGSNLVDIGGGYQAKFENINLPESGSAFRWKIVTGLEPFIYRTTLTIRVSTDTTKPSWLWYDVESDRDNARFAPPRLTSILTTKLQSEPRDRISGFTEGMRKIQLVDLGDFLDQVLNASDRLVPAFVSGGMNWSLDDEEHVEAALSRLHGIGTFWKLAPDAFTEFNSLVAPGYQVYPGSIHSFQFDLDTEDAHDAKRHWWFSAAEVRQSDPRDLSRRLHSEAMRSNLHIPLPEELIELRPLFDQEESRLLFAQFGVERSPAVSTPKTQTDIASEANAVTSEPTTLAVSPVLEADVATKVPAPSDATKSGALDLERQTEPLFKLQSLLNAEAKELALDLPKKSTIWEGFKLLIDHLKASLRATSLKVVDATRFAGLQGQFEALQKDKAEALKEVEEVNELLQFADEEAELQAGVLDEQRDIASREKQRADHLASELAKLQQNRGETVQWEIPEQAAKESLDAKAVPTSVEDLLKQVDALPYVIFTGDTGVAAKITDYKLRSTILRDAWRIAVELNRYADYKEKNGGGLSLFDYVRDHSTKVTQGEFAPRETKALQNDQKYRQARIFPVPAAVDPAEKVFMGAHFRLTQDSGKAVRMHLHDGTDQTGCVYIGYIGAHLRSRRTN